MLSQWLDVVLLGAVAVLAVMLLRSATTGAAPSEPPWETWTRWTVILPALVALQATDDSLTAVERWGRGLFAGAWAVAFVIEALRWKLAKSAPSIIKAGGRE